MKTVYYKIEDNLYQGGMPDIQIPRNITVALTLTTAPVTGLPDNVQVQIWMPIEDSFFPGVEWLETAVRLVETVIKSGHVVYIHCRGGVSRSAMVTIAYLMKTKGWSLQRAMDKVGAENETISPNPRFIIGLREYEEILKK